MRPFIHDDFLLGGAVAHDLYVRFARDLPIVDYHCHLSPEQMAGDHRFRSITEAYAVLSDPEKRAKYDVVHQKQRDDRWRLIASGAQTENDFEMEQIVRLSVLEALYTRRRLEPTKPGIPFRDFEKMTSRPREHLEFTIWFLQKKHFVEFDDKSNLTLTVEGAEYLEQSYRSNLQQKRLHAAKEES